MAALVVSPMTGPRHRPPIAWRASGAIMAAACLARYAGSARFAFMIADSLALVSSLSFLPSAADLMRALVSSLWVVPLRALAARGCAIFSAARAATSLRQPQLLV